MHGFGESGFLALALDSEGVILGRDVMPTRAQPHSAAAPPLARSARRAPRHPPPCGPRLSTPGPLTVPSPTRSCPPNYIYIYIYIAAPWRRQRQASRPRPPSRHRGAHARAPLQASRRSHSTAIPPPCARRPGPKPHSTAILAPGLMPTRGPTAPESHPTSRLLGVPAHSQPSPQATHAARSPSHHPPARARPAPLAIRDPARAGGRARPKPTTEGPNFARLW